MEQVNRTVPNLPSPAGAEPYRRHVSRSDPPGALGSFLLPEGFSRLRVPEVLRESSLVAEAGRYAVRSLEERRGRGSSYSPRPVPATGDPVVLVPGFLAGDATLCAMGRVLRRRGFRTYRSTIRANVGCTLNASALLESRLESIAIRRGSQVQVVGHSLGGMLARGLAARRSDLVSGVVTLGSPMLAPGAHHVLLSSAVEALVRLSQAGVPGLMSEDCVGGACARQGFAESRELLPSGVGFTAVYSKRDGIVDWRACLDPQATAVEVSASHIGMAVDPRVIDVVTDALRRHAQEPSVFEVDRGESA